MKHILLAEDDAELAESIMKRLRQEGFLCTRVYDGELAWRAAEQEAFDLVLLDVNLPRLSGFDLCQRLRLRSAQLPIIMITALGDIESKMDAFRLGADDYLVKPFHHAELVAKVKVFLKRAESLTPVEESLAMADLRVNLHHKTVSRAQQPIELTPKEFNLLVYLLRHSPRVVSKDELASNLWDGSYGVSNNAIEVYISFLRNKVDKNFSAKLIHTKPGFGYYMDRL
ncbi:MAG: response regulator transcription factor [Cytophagales bacterium]|nr:response regulator transcription factor [Cytophagales bacterium]